MSDPLFAICSIILVTLTLRPARPIADHIVSMYLGEIIEAGPAEEILNHPKEQLTKDYFQEVSASGFLKLFFTV